MASVVCGYLLTAPGDDFFEAISFQLERGAWHAWALFGSVAFLSLLFMPELARRGRKGSVVVFASCVGLFSLVAMTDPRSTFHLACFVALAFVAVAWLVSMACDYDDRLLYYLAAGAFLSGVISPIAWGLGERLLVLFVLAGINVVHFGYLRNGRLGEFQARLSEPSSGR